MPSFFGIESLKAFEQDLTFESFLGKSKFIYGIFFWVYLIYTVSVKNFVETSLKNQNELMCQASRLAHVPQKKKQCIQYLSFSLYCLIIKIYMCFDDLSFRSIFFGHLEDPNLVS